MARNGKKARRLVVGEEIFFWSLRHRHRVDDGRYDGCCEVLAVRAAGASGRLVIAFSEGPGRLVPDGFLHSGAVGTTEGVYLNLHEPGTVRALLDEAMSRGWRSDDPSVGEMDGWALFDAVAGRRSGVRSD